MRRSPKRTGTAVSHRPKAQVVDLADVLARSIKEAKKPAYGQAVGERRAPRQLAARAAGSTSRRGRKG